MMQQGSGPYYPQNNFLLSKVRNSPRLTTATNQPKKSHDFPTNDSQLPTPHFRLNTTLIPNSNNYFRFFLPKNQQILFISLKWKGFVG